MKIFKKKKRTKKQNLLEERENYSTMLSHANQTLEDKESEIKSYMKSSKNQILTLANMVNITMKI